jgi:integrase/recombinase XerC
MLDSEISSWALSLRSRHLSPKTIKTYLESVNQLAAFIDVGSGAEITRRHIEAYFTSLYDTGRTPGTVAVRHRSLQQFFRWLIEEEEIDRSPMERMKLPAVPAKPIPIIEPSDIDQLLASLAGRSFFERRDRAIVSVLYDTGIRRSECAGLRTEAVDIQNGIAVVLGKGSKLRPVAFGEKVMLDLDRYLRIRAKHAHASSPMLWIGQKGALSDDGIRQMLQRRGKALGQRLSPHRFRHTFAHEFLDGGGSNLDLQKLGGWDSPQMLQRYGASGATQRALSAHRKLSPRDRRH